MKKLIKKVKNGEDYPTSIERCENFTELSFMRAKYYYKKRKYKRASRNINKALELKPNNEEFQELKSKITKKDT